MVSKGSTGSAPQYLHTYQQAAKLHNPDATARLAALVSDQALTRQQHTHHVDITLIRCHTAASQRAGRAGPRHEESMAEVSRVTKDASQTAFSYMSPRVDQVAIASGNDYPPRLAVPPSSPQADRRESYPPSSPRLSTPQLPRSPEVIVDARLNPTRSPQPDGRPRYQLQDILAPQLPSPKRVGNKSPEPQTFAEMGFVSKPIEDEGCCVM